MKKSMLRYSSPVLVVAAVGTVLWVNAGSLTPPPGPVAPTMKDLETVEPRVALRNDYVGLVPIKITLPGSYYLAEDITAFPGSNGIEIDASNVTLDLRGFTIYGNLEVGSTNGITVSGIRTNITIRNGTVRDFFTHGINLINATSVHIEGVKAVNNVQRGISLGDHANAVDCVASNNGDSGIRSNGNAIVSRSVTSNNGQYGITVGPGSVISNCIARANVLAGISASGSTVEHCAAAENAGDGFSLSGGMIAHCTAFNNTGNGIQAGGSSVLHNESRANDAAGIVVNSVDCRVDSNNVTGNLRGIDVNVGSNVIIRNTASANGTNYDIAVGNDVGPIGTAALATSPWANIQY